MQQVVAWYSELERWRTAMAAAAQPGLIPVGAFKSFGEYGPVYQVLGAAPRGPKGEMSSIQVIPSLEVLDYPLADMLVDPPAR